MGWTPNVALRANVNHVLMALDERSDLISMIFGDGKKRRGKKKKPTAAEFREFAAQINRHRAQQDG